jgi:hypothetical protein
MPGFNHPAHKLASVYAPGYKLPLIAAADWLKIFRQKRLLIAAYQTGSPSARAGETPCGKLLSIINIILGVI